MLVVDDYPDAAESLTMLLKYWGHEVRFCHSGPEALTAARTFRPGAALLDIGLPGMVGYNLARRLRDQLKTGNPRPDYNPSYVSSYGV